VGAGALINVTPTREGSKKKICDTNPLVVVVKRGKFQESLTELNIAKQRNFVLGGGGIINYANCKLFFSENPHIINR